MFLVGRQGIQYLLFYSPAAHVTTLFSLSLVPADTTLSDKTMSWIPNSNTVAGVCHCNWTVVPTVWSTHICTTCGSVFSESSVTSWTSSCWSGNCILMGTSFMHHTVGSLLWHRSSNSYCSYISHPSDWDITFSVMFLVQRQGIQYLPFCFPATHVLPHSSPSH